MLTLTTKLSLALLVSFLSPGCATTSESQSLTAAAEPATGEPEVHERLGIEVSEAAFIEEDGKWYVTGELRSRRPLPPSLRRVQVDVVDKDGKVVYSKAAVARSYAVSAHTSRNAAKPLNLSLATFRIAIPDPATFDHADIKIVKQG